jgi:hypothetical protein
LTYNAYRCLHYVLLLQASSSRSFKGIKPSRWILNWKNLCHECCHLEAFLVHLLYQTAVMYPFWLVPLLSPKSVYHL